MINQYSLLSALYLRGYLASLQVLLRRQPLTKQLYRLLRRPISKLMLCPHSSIAFQPGWREEEGQCLGHATNRVEFRTHAFQTRVPAGHEDAVLAPVNASA